MRNRLRVMGMSGLFLLAVCSAVFGVVKKEHRPRGKQVRLLHADKLYHNAWENPLAQILVGNVRFEHEGTLMFCDSALYYEATNSFDAFGNVRMLQGDTLMLTGRVLYYNGVEQMAKVRENVVLRHRKTTLYTDSLDYDRLYSLGYFFDGGRLIDGDNQLTSDWGEYNPQTRDAVFNYNVRLVNPRPPQQAKNILLSDTLCYNTLTGIAITKGPSNIDNTGSHIYTEYAVYDTRLNRSHLLNRSILQNGYKHLVGDSITWDAETKIGRAFGNAIYTDTLNQNKFTGNYLMYNDSTGYAEAADSALLMDYSQGDTLYTHADSLFLFTYNIGTDSVYRKLHAYKHVKSYRSDLQAVCDSLVYNGKDSCMTLYRDPIVWYGSQQLLGERIVIWHNDSTIDSIYVVDQALSVERLDSIHYNQVSANEFHSYFRQGVNEQNVADKNVRVIYYPLDDDSLMIGLNYVESSQLRMWMQERHVKKIWTPAATGTLYPLALAPADKLYLPGFAWFNDIRPISPQDVFNWRGKRKEQELKPTVRHQAPRQRLEDVNKKQKKQ